MRIATSPRLNPSHVALLVAAAGFITTYVGMGLTQDGERIASIWPGNALALGALLLLPRTAWKLLLAAAFIGYFLANLLLGDTLVPAIGLAAANSIEIMIGAVLMHLMLGDARTDMSRKWLVRLVVFAGLVACAASATIAALVLSPSGDRFAEVWATYFPAHLIGVITLTPVLLALSGRREIRREFRIGSNLLQISVLSLCVSIALFAQGTTPLLYLMFPVLTFAAFRAGISGAAAALFIFTIVATAFTLRGYGPITVIGGGERIQILFLQILILVATLTTMPIGFALADRKAAFVLAKVSAAEANEANHAKSRFLANMSHEIRTPLNGVLGFAELLGNSQLDAGQKRQVTMIQQSATTLLQLLNDILDLSKVEAGQMRIVPEPMQLAGRIGDCADLIRPLAESKGVGLQVDIGSDLPEWLVSDHLRLRQIMLNLLGNAVKFSHGGTITISARAAAEGRLEVAVTDQGIGIPADRVDHLFADFVQAEDTTAHSYGGTGLGLAISRKLARLMGGDLRLESTQGLGTTVLLDLPLVISEAPDAVPDVAPESRPAVPGHLLVVDDLDINREIVGTMLENLGHSFETAINGLDAIAKVEAAERAGRAFDAILMDVRMPEMDGIEAARRIKGRPSSAALPIIGLTANAFTEDLEDCRAAGMCEIVSKPVSTQMLGAALVRSLGRDQDRSAPVAPRPVPHTAAPNNALQARYAERKMQSIERISQLMAQGLLEHTTLAEIAEIAHKLAGAAGMFSDAGFGDKAYDLELTVRAQIGKPHSADNFETIDTAFSTLEAAA